MTVLVYIVCCLIWGSTWLAIKMGLEDSPPLYGAGIRFALAVCVLAAIVYFRKSPLPTTVRQTITWAFPGFWMYAVSYSCVYIAEQYIDSSLAAILFGAFPFIVALLMHYYLKTEKMTPLAWAGLVAGLAGVTLISYDSLHQSQQIFLGSLLVLTAATVSAWGLALHKKHCGTADIFAVALVQMAFGSLVLLLAAVLFEDFATFKFTTTAVLSTVYLAIFGTVVAFLGYYWLLKRLTAVTASLIAFVTPLVAIVIGAAFYDEKLGLLALLGTAMILSGIILVTKGKQLRQKIATEVNG